MEFQASTLWWVLAGALVIAELLTGTFYLLMLALGSVAAAVAAHAGATGSGQFVAAALVGGGATAAWHFKRARAPRSAPAASNADVSPDIGQTVQVHAWQDDGQRAQVDVPVQVERVRADAAVEVDEGRRERGRRRRRRAGRLTAARLAADGSGGRRRRARRRDRRGRRGRPG